MSGDILAAVLRVQTDMLTVEGIRMAPAYPPEQMSAFPFAVAYLKSGIWEKSIPSLITSKHVIAAQLHIARKNLPMDIKAAMFFAYRVAQALLDDQTLNGQVLVIERIPYTFGPLGWGGVDTIGFEWTLNVSILNQE